MDRQLPNGHKLVNDDLIVHVTVIPDDNMWMVQGNSFVSVIVPGWKVFSLQKQLPLFLHILGLRCKPISPETKSVVVGFVSIYPTIVRPSRSTLRG